jgi:NAD kinase
VEAVEFGTGVCVTAGVCCAVSCEGALVHPDTNTIAIRSVIPMRHASFRIIEPDSSIPIKISIFTCA